ncbi:MAG: acyltransferase [Prolixibacteraceae bacterium]|nr:acyltransferase [Prolixibacteraceae bacterium]
MYTKRNYLPGIDGLRAIAVLAVIIFHVNFIPFFEGGFTGVDIFFVISGYVISRSLFNRSFGSFRNYLSQFYVRRIKRIVPALVVCLVVTILLSTLFIPPTWLSDTINKTGLSAFFGFSNFSLIWNNDGYFSPSVEFNPFLHTWSLAVEEQFYLIFPAIFYLWLKNSKGKSTLSKISGALLIVLTIFSFVISVFETSAFHDRAFYLLPARFWELAAGALLFQLHSKNTYIVKSKNLSSLFIVVGFALIISGIVLANQQAFPFPWALAPVVGTVLIIDGVVQPLNSSFLLTRLLSSSFMTYIGKISYSLYLWHWPVAVLLRWTVGLNTYWLLIIYLAVSFFFAIISYHFIESPVRRSNYLIKQKNRKLIVGGLAVLLITFSTAQLIVKSKQSLSLSVTKDNYIWRSWAFQRDKLEQPEIEDWNVNGRRIFALGDSHTAAYRTMLNIVSGQLGVEVHEYENGGCAIAGLLKPMSELGNCQAFYEKSFREIKELARPGDIVFLASLRMPEISNRFEPVDITSVVEEFNSKDAIKNRQIALEEASLIIKEFEDIGLNVLIVAPEPVLKAPPFRCSDWFNKMNPIAAPGLTISRDFLAELRQPVLNSLKILQQKHQSLHVWDPFLVLCKEDVFSAYDNNGLPVFYDGDHLSAHGNRLLAPSFKKELLSIWKEQD